MDYPHHNYDSAYDHYHSNGPRRSPQSHSAVPSHSMSAGQQQPVFHQPSDLSKHPMVVIPQRQPHQGHAFQYGAQQHPSAPNRPWDSSWMSSPSSVQQKLQQPHQVQQHFVVNQNHAAHISHPVVEIPARPPSSGGTSSHAEHQLLLLSLAEEYVTAAYKIGSKAALSNEVAERTQYYKLLALGLGCMETMLNRWRLYPRLEAIVRLRYASLLFAETDNISDTEMVLSRGITLCERNRLWDLKYGMQHLLARVLHRTSDRAGLKYLDNLIPDVEAYQHVPWLYAFRFLRVTLSVQSKHIEYAPALQNLRLILSTAESRGDSAVFVTAASLEAMVHLRARSPESDEQAQRSIATARSYQIQMIAQDFSEVNTLLDCVDLVCNLQHCAIDIALTKLKAIQGILDGANRAASPQDDQTFAVPIENGFGGHLTQSTGDVFRKDAQGRDLLTFTWLRRKDLGILGYYLSAVTTYTKNAVDDRAEGYLKEGLKMVGHRLNHAEVSQESLCSASARATWQSSIGWFMRLHLAFIQTIRGDWHAAQQSLRHLQAGVEIFATSTQEPLLRFTTYLQGIVHQGTGSLDAALASYRSPILAIPETMAGRKSGPGLDLPLLANLNSLSIISDPGHPDHHLAGVLVDRIGPLCLDHPNKALVSAFYFSRANATKANPLLTLRANLQSALHSARAVLNNQLMCFAMSLMTASLFHNISGEQAEKSATTSRGLATRSGSHMWLCVTNGMLADTLEMRGRHQEAQHSRTQAEEHMKALPSELKQACFGS